MLGGWVVLALIAGSRDCQLSEKEWSRTGLEAPCVVLSGATHRARLESAMKRWALTEEQARCAIDAANSARGLLDYEAFQGKGADWRRCVERWPQVKVLWVGLLAAWDYEYAEGLVAKLAPAPADGGSSLAEELLEFGWGPRAELALHLLKTQPQRLSSLLGGREDFEIALTTLEERRATIRPEDWGLVGRALITRPLQQHELALAADLWMELPEQIRSTLRKGPIPEATMSLSERFTWERTERGDLRSLLALGLIVSGRKDEAGLIPLSGESPLVDDLVTWHLTGKRTIDPWEAAIAARNLRHGLLGADFLVAFYPFIAPHFALHDVHRLLERGFESGVAPLPASMAARLRSARARAFLRLRELEQQRGSTSPVNATQAAQLSDAIGKAYGDRFRPQELTIFWNGQDHAFFEFSTGTGRADRGPSGQWKVVILSSWIRCL